MRLKIIESEYIKFDVFLKVHPLAEWFFDRGLAVVAELTEFFCNITRLQMCRGMSPTLISILPTGNKAIKSLIVAERAPFGKKERIKNAILQ